LTDINELILKKQDLSYLSKIFNDNFGVRPYTNSEGKQVVKYYSIPMWHNDSEGNPQRHDIKKVGRPYVFNVEKILDKTDLDLWHDLYGKVAKKPEAEQITIDQAIQFAELEAAELKQIPGKDIPF
jgi:hypothetical protein